MPFLQPRRDRNPDTEMYHQPDRLRDHEGPCSLPLCKPPQPGTGLKHAPASRLPENLLSQQYPQVKKGGHPDFLLSDQTHAGLSREP